MAARAQNITDPHPILRNISNNILLGTLSSYACEKSINVTYQVTFFLGGISRNNRNDTTICSRQPLFCAPASSRYGINHSINLEHSAIPYSFAREFILIPREFRALDLSPFLNIANNFALAQDTSEKMFVCFCVFFFSW